MRSRKSFPTGYNHPRARSAEDTVGQLSHHQFGPPPQAAANLVRHVPSQLSGTVLTPILSAIGSDTCPTEWNSFVGARIRQHASIHPPALPRALLSYG